MDRVDYQKMIEEYVEEASIVLSTEDFEIFKKRVIKNIEDYE